MRGGRAAAAPRGRAGAGCRRGAAGCRRELPRTATRWPLPGGLWHPPCARERGGPERSALAKRRLEEELRLPEPAAVRSCRALRRQLCGWRRSPSCAARVPAVRVRGRRVRDPEASRCGRAVAVPLEHLRWSVRLGLRWRCRRSSPTPRLTREAFGPGCDMRLSHVRLTVRGWAPGGAATRRSPAVCFCTEEGKGGSAGPVSEVLCWDAAPPGESIKSLITR